LAQHQAVIGDSVFYITADGTSKPAIHEAWVEQVGQARILVRPTASPSGDVTGNSRGNGWLDRPENLVVVKGHGFA
jgi:hypothetical protein